MDLRKLTLCAVLLMSLFVSPVLAATTTANCVPLSRNLKAGMKGADVKLLQQILNRSTDTMISATGPGSPGFESDFFGKKTTDAVIRFQNLYRSDVLLPAGLTKGTGFVGSLSRAKLNALCVNTGKSGVVSGVSGKSTYSKKGSNKATQISVPESLTHAIALVPQKSNVFVPTKITKPWMGDGKFPTPEVVMTSDTLMEPGSTFIIFGVGFTGETPNTLHIGEKYKISNLGVDETGTIVFTVPNDVPKGRHYIWVTNSKGSGNRDNFIIVPTPGRAGPNVRLGTPSYGKVGSIVTVYGTGFSATWNDIHFPTQIVRGVVSVDGKTLSFKVPPPEVEAPEPGEEEEDMTFYPDIVSTYSIVNDYGVWDGVPFTVKFK